MQDRVHKLMTGLIRGPLWLKSTLKLLDLGDEACQVLNYGNDNEQCEDNDDEILHIGRRMMGKKEKVVHNC